MLKQKNVPFQFIQSVKNIGKGRSIRLAVIREVKVVKCITLNEDGTCNDDFYKPARPWFYLDCTGLGHLSPKFDIVSDGTEWHPAKRYSGIKRISSNTRPKKSVNLLNLSTVDQELIQSAITTFLSRRNLNADGLSENSSVS